MTDTVALYLRLSPRPDGQYEGVDRQEGWGRAYAERTWPGARVRVFSDSGISAANGDHRPGYEALRDAVANRQVTQLWTVEQSRLERQEVGWFLLAAELAEAGITEVHTDRDGIVRVGDDAAGIKAVLAAGEVRRLRRRVNDALDSLAAAGRPGGAHHPAYRHSRNGDGEATLEVIPEVAAEMRWAASRVLAGDSLQSIAHQLQERGVPTAHGGRWTHNNVKGALTAPVIAGLRVHRGQVVRKGNWEPVLDETTWRLVCATLDRPGRQPARTYLLTGVARCGRCGQGLSGRQQHARGKVRPVYFCTSCKRLGVNAEPLEAHVVDQLLDALDSPAFKAAMSADDREAERDELVEQLSGIEARHVELAERWASGDLPAEAWDRARARLDERHRELTEALAAMPSTAVDIDPATIRAGWDSMTLGERRAVLAMFIESVTVAPATPGIKRFDPARVEIAWV